MQLVEQGRLALDAPIEAVLPHLAARQVLDGFVPVRHTVPMLSIRTETDTEATGAEAFDARVRREPKRIAIAARRISSRRRSDPNASSARRTALLRPPVVGAPNRKPVRPSSMAGDCAASARGRPS